MDVIFEPQKGNSFSIEVGFFDSIQEVKEKIQKYQGIPIPRQTLIFKSQVLEDDYKIENSEILQNSHIQLIIDAENEPSPPCKKTIKLSIKSHSSSKSCTVEVEATDTIGIVKEKIQKIDPTMATDSFTLHSNGSDPLQDSLTVGEMTTLESAEIELRTTIHTKNNYHSPPGNNAAAAVISSSSPSAAAAAPPPNSAPAVANSSKKLRVKVLTKGGTKKIPVEVNAGDNVGNLRIELQRLQQTMNFSLPPEGYFFIYRQNVMDDDRSYRWHSVGNGDTIEIFNGSVTGGS